MLLFGDRNHAFHRIVEAGDFLHSAWTVESTGVEAIQAGKQASGVDNVIRRVEDTQRLQYIAVAFLA